MRESSSNLPSVSVVIPNYNGARTIGDCLSSVLALDYTNFEIVLVDDASTDESLAIVRSSFPDIKIIENSKNLGFVRAVNRGIRVSGGEIVVLLNMDTVVRGDWLKQLVKGLISDREIAIVGSKILDADQRTIQHAGGMLNNNAVAVHLGRGEADSGQYDCLREVDYVCGASIGFRRKLLREIGYLDEGFSPLYYEDTDLAFRAKRRGYRVVYVPESVLSHHENYSTNGLNARFYYLFHKGRIRFAIKNYEFRYLFTQFLKAELQWFKDFQPREFKRQLLAAYFANIFSLPKKLFYKKLVK
ncbi:glycosyltransferase family 2 protein [Candidatus Omnitrophota bacterium]